MRKLRTVFSIERHGKTEEDVWFEPASEIQAMAETENTVICHCIETEEDGRKYVHSFIVPPRFATVIRHE